MSGQIAAEAAITRATTAANRKMPGWSDDAYQALGLFIEKVAGEEFMAEDVRAWAEGQGLLDVAVEPRAWGGVFRRAVAAGAVRKIGYRASGNSQAHVRPTAVWKAA